MTKKQVLVVDDDKDIVAAIDTILKMEEYSVIHAYSGTESIHLAMECKPDVILLDYMLPDMSGRQIVKILRKKLHFTKLPIILISAVNDIQEIAKTIEVNACISKPFELEELVTCVAKQLSCNSHLHN